MSLTAVCGGARNEHAKLLLKSKQSTLQVSFAKENCIMINCTKVGVQDSINIHFDRKVLSFYADSNEDHLLWLKYCRFLKIFPYYLIPEEPKYNKNYKSAMKKFNTKHNDAGT